MLNHDLLDRGEITRPTIVRHDRMVSEFLREVRTKSEQAARQNVPLLLLVFCHGLQNYSFTLDYKKDTRGPTIAQVRAVLHPHCRVTLYSTACFSGGWVHIRLDEQRQPGNAPFNMTMQAAAAADITSTSWVQSVKGRFSGSVFTGATIEALTAASSPLVDPATTAGTELSESLQPDDPTAEQTQAYDAFCHSIADICRDRLSRHPMTREFTFSAADDQWELSWTEQTAVPLGYFEKRWNALPVRSYTGPPRDIDPSPFNPLGSSNVTGVTRTGGVMEPQDLIDRMTESIARQSIQTMAELFIQTCPGDWTRGYGPMSSGILREYLECRENPEEETNVGAMIQYRWELGLLADDLIARRGLPAPGNQMCLLLNIEDDWRPKNEIRIPDFSDRWAMVTQYLFRQNFTPSPTPAQGPPFGRFMRYITAAIVGARLSKEENMSVTRALVEDMEQVKAFYRMQALANQTVRERGRMWLTSIGKRFRHAFRQEAGSGSGAGPST